MTIDNSIAQWYALFVKTGEEDKVKERLEYRFAEELRILVPKRKLRERRGGIWSFNIRNIFPGYVLVNGYIDNEKYYRFKNIPGLFKLLRAGHDPLMIEPREMEYIAKLTINSEIIGISEVLIENEKIIVVDGPLTSMEGLIESIDRRKGRAKVRLHFMGEERTVELGISLVKPV